MYEKKLESMASEQEITETGFTQPWQRFLELGIIWDWSASVGRLGSPNSGTIKIKLIYLGQF